MHTTDLTVMPICCCLYESRAVLAKRRCRRAWTESCACQTAGFWGKAEAVCPELELHSQANIFAGLGLSHGHARLQAFGAKLMLVRRSSWEGDQPQSPSPDMRLASWTDLPSLLPQADLVFLTCSLNDETRGLVDSTFLSKCKPGVRIINVARGGSFHSMLTSWHAAGHTCGLDSLDWEGQAAGRYRGQDLMGS